MHQTDGSNKLLYFDYEDDAVAASRELSCWRVAREAHIFDSSFAMRALLRDNRIVAEQ